MTEEPFSPGSHLSAGAGSRWIDVFQQRGVWQLTRDIVDVWVARNAVFFSMLMRHVPSGSKILELGCGPGRHALGAATLGYAVTGIDIDPEIVKQAEANALSLGWDRNITFGVGDMFSLQTLAPKGTFRAITHGGVMEHLESAEIIRESLCAQLAYAPLVIFDIPFNSEKNRRLFERDDIFRQLWTAEEWIGEALAGLPVIETGVDLHSELNMTDDLVVALRR
jgi:SAM-dependent methyltransferase